VGKVLDENHPMVEAELVGWNACIHGTNAGRIDPDATDAGVEKIGKGFRGGRRPSGGFPVSRRTVKE